MFTDFLSEIFSDNKEKDALIWQDRKYLYEYLLRAFQDWRKKLDESGIAKNSVVLLEADFSPNALTLMLALIEQECIIVPLTASVMIGKIVPMNTVSAVLRKMTFCSRKMPSREKPASSLFSLFSVSSRDSHRSSAP